ncbi:MAG: hypothetical protein ACLTDF_12230 [Coprococcus sp.]
MGSENVFQENQEYLIKARELVVAIDDVQDNLEQARTAQRKTSRSISQEEKGLSDEISSTLKNRKNEIEDGYDQQLSANGAKIRQLQSKKDKKKTERMGNRIESETASLNESNRQLRLKAKELFKQNNVSGFCNTGFFYCMFAPCGAGDVFKLILLILCSAMYKRLYAWRFIHHIPDRVHTLTYVVISQAIVIAEFIICFIVFNLAKVKNLEIVNEGRRIRNKSAQQQADKDHQKLDNKRQG